MNSCSISIFSPVSITKPSSSAARAYWRAVVLLAFAGLLAMAWAGEYGIQLNYEHHLAEVRDQYGVALAQSQQLTKLEQDLKPWQAQAELWTYLRHPWPRSQILRQVLQTLPPQITLCRIGTEREAIATDSGQPTAPPRTLEETRADDARRLPAERDLRRLRAEIDSTQVVVTLEGLTRTMSSCRPILADFRRRDCSRAASSARWKAATRITRASPCSALA